MGDDQSSKIKGDLFCFKKNCKMAPKYLGAQCLFVAVYFYLLHEPLDNWLTNPGTGLQSGRKKERSSLCPGGWEEKGMVMETSESQVRARETFGEYGQVMSIGGNSRRTGPLLLGTESDHVSPEEGGVAGEGGEAGWGDGKKLGCL